MAIIYNPNYNVSFGGLEKLHPFDSCKYQKIFERVKPLLSEDNIIITDREASEEELLTVHTDDYIESLNSSSKVAQVCELWPLFLLPNCILQKCILSPMRYQVRGTILAGEIAMEKGLAINIGGGMHHASSDDGGGWCVYSDIIISLKNLREKGLVKKALIIDLDVHQGNGIESDLLTHRLTRSVTMVDIYNPDLYPSDEHAKKAIDYSDFVQKRTSDREYLRKVEMILQASMQTSKPDIVFYNAGSDILKGDPLNGGVSISAKAVSKRDEMVMKYYKDRNVPVVMVLSGGYASDSAKVIGDSLVNLVEKLGM